MPSTDHTSQRSAGADLAERETHGISAGQPVVVDSLALIDHRTRERMIPEDGAPAGRYLSVESGEADRSRLLLALTRPITHIGRGLVADVRFEDSLVSRRHAIVALRGDGVRILDDRSSHGTFVNGRPVTVAELADGDVVRIGRAVFRYVEVTAACAATDHDRPLRRIPMSAVRRRRLGAPALRRTAVG